MCARARALRLALCLRCEVLAPCARWCVYVVVDRYVW